MRAVTLFSTLVLLSAVTTYAAETVVKDTRLVQAAKTGDSTTAVALLNKRVDPNSAEPDGTTALHWAVRNNDSALVDRLLRAGADAKAANRYGVTAIALACESASAPVIERLVAGGVSVNATGPYGETALHTCARAGNVDGAKALIARGASIDAGDSWRGQTPLMWATAQKHPAAMRVLIEAGADVNARSTIIAWERQRTSEPRDKWLPPGGLTPMLFAAREGCVDCTRVLLSAGANPDIVDPDQYTPLIIALINGHFDVAGALIDAGANVDMQDKVGRTALWAAVDAHTIPSSNRPAPRETDDTLSSMDIITRLLDRGANVDLALRAQVPYRTKLDRGGDGVLGPGTTPLLRAAKAGDVPVIKMLLAKGANPRAVTTRGNVNPIMMAANVAAREEDMTGRQKTQKEAIESIRLLLAAGTDINGADTQGRTAAHGAAMWGWTDVVRFLHENGLKLDIEDKRGYTALDTALGLAGGFGFGGSAGVVHEETAKVIRELGGVPGHPKPAAPGRATDRNQDDPQSGDRN
ncbi:MAG TPA: ankyrin repeat domain-containing protein [Vicinamibacterales bacterium]|nr:ankyrin repeat domain-containing protein [Vicinamibacterales bacterium]